MSKEVIKIDALQNEVEHILLVEYQQGYMAKLDWEKICENQAIAVTTFFRIKAPEFIEFDKEWVMKLLKDSGLVPEENIERIAEGLKIYYPIKLKGN